MPAARKRPTRQRLSTEERREQLLALGIRLFSTRSYEEISIDDVAREAGMSKGLLYHYFRDKREFYVATIRAISDELRRLTAPDPGLPPERRLRAALDAHLRYIDEHGPLYAAVYTSGVGVAGEVSGILSAHRETIVRYLAGHLGVARPGARLEAALRAFVGMVEGASLDHIAHHRLSRDDLRDLLLAGFEALVRAAGR